MSSPNQTSSHDISRLYKLFFDDIEEIFLHKISVRLLYCLILITCSLMFMIFLLLMCRSKQVFLSSTIPFYYTLVIYDFFQLISILLLKYNFTEEFFNQLCQWTYYLKSISESGQCLTLIFLFGLMRHQIRYFSAHNHLPNSSRINSRALTFVCLLFVVYVNNWITHLKIEKSYLIKSNVDQHDIHIQELPIYLYDTPEIKGKSYYDFINDLEKYSSGFRQINSNQNESASSSTNDNIFHNPKDGHEIIIRVRFPNIFNSGSNRTRRSDFTQQKNASYRINRCTYSQENYFLSNFLSFIHSIFYLVLLTYYLTIILTTKHEKMSVRYQQKLYEQSVLAGRKKSAERHKHYITLLNLKEFFYLIFYSHTILTYFRLIYQCFIILFLYFIPTPFKWLPLKTILYFLFCLIYFSIPIRMLIIFLFIVRTYFSLYIHSLIVYLFHTNLRFSWKFQKPTICFRFQFIPYPTTLIQEEHRTNSLVIDVSSSVDEDHSHFAPHESVVVYDENSVSHHIAPTSAHSTAAFFPIDSPTNTSVIAKL